jgi:hypothetical protein
LVVVSLVIGNNSIANKSAVASFIFLLAGSVNY